MTTTAQPSVQDLLADPALFAAWLESMPEDAHCGDCGDPNSCVIHNFLAARLPDDDDHSFVSVGKYDVLVGFDPASAIQYDLPPWTRQLVAAIDALGKGRMVTAGTALAILEALS